MSTVVYSLHCALVFGVPLLFGWVLLRRVFREANWLALAPGALVIGLAALMAAVNELRFFYEMRIAVWTAYKGLLSLSLVLTIALPRRVPRPRLPGCVDRRWKLCLLIAGTIAVGFYYGIPAFHGYLNDAWWYHYPAAVQIQNIELFPLTHVFAMDDPIHYHFGPDILAACWSFLLQEPVQLSWGLYVAILAPCGFLLAFALIARLARNYWSALLAATLLVAGGNLRWLLFLTGKFTGAVGGLQVFNSQTVQGLLQLIFTPSHALGIPLSLAVLLMFRHFVARPSARTGSALGLTLGTLTLVAEWYFLPLLAGILLVAAHGAWRDRILRGTWNTGRISLLLLPAIVALFWGSFNNTYLAGMFGHFWMRYGSIEEAAATRQITAQWTPVTETSLPEEVSDAGPETPGLHQPVRTTPNLVPVHLNFLHFGRVASWESAASSEGSFVSIFSPRFLMEIAPVLLVGIPFGLWLAWRRRSPLILLLAWLAAISALPPIFLDWGYRSTDFLRFFTGAYCYAALFLGWLAGDWLTRGTIRMRLLGGCLATSALISPIGLGIIGLLPGTIDRVKQVATTAQSLSQSIASSAPSRADASRRQAFEKLAVATGDFLFPLTHGRGRVVVIVPANQIPALKYFPEWMKMATLSRILLPVGWHWQDSLYSAYYRDAVTKLDPRALAALDAKWVISSNLFQEELPPLVAQALKDGERFVPVARFREGRYLMTVFRVKL